MTALRSVEVTAKKVDDAIKQGLEQLGVRLDEVNVEVLDAGGLFRKAKVRLTLDLPPESDESGEPVKSAPVNTVEKPIVSPQKEKAAEQKRPEPPEKQREKRAEKAPTPEKPVREEASAQAEDGKEKSGSVPPRPKKQKQQRREKQDVPPQKPPVPKTPRVRTEEDKLAAEHAISFIKEVINKMGFTDVSFEVSEDGETLSVTAPEGDDSLIIGRHGETLSSLSYLAETCVRAEKGHVNVYVDCNGYRDRRAASLAAMARRRADECAAKHRKIKLEVMDRADRRTVHNALTEDERVTTASEGKEPHRYVVIYPKR